MFPLGRCLPPLPRLLPWRRDSTMPLTLLEAQLKPDQSRRASSAGGAALWVSLLRSSAVWAIVVNNFAFHYAFYLVMNWLPTYFNRYALYARALQVPWCISQGCKLNALQAGRAAAIYGSIAKMKGSEMLHFLVMRLSWWLCRFFVLASRHNALCYACLLQLQKIVYVLLCTVLIPQAMFAHLLLLLFATACAVCCWLTSTHWGC